MRTIVLPLLLLLTACDRKTPEVPLPDTEARQQTAAEVAVFAGPGRDRLCLNERAGRAAFITYGQGEANCSVSGVLKRSVAGGTLTPDGDESCRIEVQVRGEEIALGPVGPGCAYYCGRSASYAGAEFRRSRQTEAVTDLAGDPLC